MSKALAALLDYEQADEEGVMVLASRQAIHEVADEIEQLRAALDVVTDHLKSRCGESGESYPGEVSAIELAERLLGVPSSIE